MIPGTLNREWSLAKLRQQALLEEAEQLRQIAAARGRDHGSGATDHVRVWVRSLGSALLQGIANARLDRPSSGPRGYRDGLL